MKQTTALQVFVAYSWDSESHKENVKTFVQNLRSNGIDVIYDEELSYGKRIQHFMENSISQSDVVLFICTPDYKRRADSRISGVGYESEIITSEIYETSNEEKFIPVLFAGTWKISLPTWAKGKKGVDLSTPELYRANLPKLMSYLQSVGPNPKQTESTPQYKEAELTATEIHLDVPSYISKLAQVWEKISDPTTFRGLVLVAVISGIILLFISPFLSTLLPNSNNPPPNGSSIDDTNSNSDGFNDSFPDDILSDSAPPDNITPDITFNRDDYILEYLTSRIDDSTPNGTMPKGATLSLLI